ncbi:hypothetical protein JTE90_013730 [Oedothorax gibbosus]|uniref:Gustatory receptor n=1 Tax=Oedothorax gibbosus TaxID=931172 RepID=A0AAV6V0X5_9ARAC|nr:hypothetical protein JTE90_013730 [Oedothorax gibbosus]
MVATLILTQKRRKIDKAIQNIFRLSAKSHQGIVQKEDVHTFILALLSGVLIFTIMAINILFLKQTHKARVDSQKFFGMVLSTDMRKYYMYTHYFLFVFTSIFSLVTQMFVSLLSFHTFLGLSKDIKKYRESLAKLLVSNFKDEVYIHGYLVGFRRIVDCISRVEAGFSYTNLFLIAANVSSFFVFFSIAASAENGYHQTAVAVLITSVLLLSLIQFLSMVGTAARVCKEDDALKKLVIRCSEKAFSDFQGKVSMPKLHCFALLANTIRGTTLELTGGDMFVIKDNFIMSVVGVMLTYGVLIFQFGNH